MRIENMKICLRRVPQSPHDTVLEFNYLSELHRERNRLLSALADPARVAGLHEPLKSLFCAA